MLLYLHIPVLFLVPRYYKRLLTSFTIDKGECITYGFTYEMLAGGNMLSDKYCSEPDVKSHSIHDEYEIKWNQKLGSGVSGPVRLCIHRESGQEFALKILLDKEKSRNEVSLHWSCSASDYIVRIVDVFANNIKLPNESIPKARLLVVMEMMKGGELFEYITSNQRFTEREASSLTYQIARAIKHCHSLNIAHRDLKPENLLLYEKARDPENVHLKLGDFGFAKVDNGDLRTPQFTPYYVAPQVLEAQKRQRERQSGRLPPGSPYHYDKSCDMWSLGVIVYIMLCGYPPFYSEIPHKPLSQNMQTKIMSGNYEFPPNEWASISLEAKNVIRALLHVDPAERMNIDELLQHKWLQSSQVSDMVLPSPQIMLNRMGLEETKMAHSTIVSAMRRKDTSFQLKSMENANNNLLSKRKVQLNIGIDDKGSDNTMTDVSHIKQVSTGPHLQRLIDYCAMPPPTPSSTDPCVITDAPHITLIQDTLAESCDKPFYKQLLQVLELESWNGQYFTSKVDWHRLGDNVKNIF